MRPDLVLSMFSVERAEAGACLFDFVEDEQQVLQRARQAVELPDSEHVAGSEPIEQGCRQFGRRCSPPVATPFRNLAVFQPMR